MLGAAVFGTGGLPFIVGAALAFGGGIALYYRSCLSQALLALENYPHLMLLHLDGNYPTQRWDMGRVKALLDGRDNGWVDKSMLVTSWQSAGPALDEVQAQKENSIVAGIVEQTTREYRADNQESM